MIASKIKKELRSYATPERKKTNEWFFKTGAGEYGEHDRFLGIMGPDIRLVAKKYADLDFENLQELLSSRFNEERVLALRILVARFERKKITKKEREKIYKFFVKNLKNINNWNLVDISVPHILGEYLFENKSELKILDRLSSSKFHWHRRASILATWAFIKRDDLRYIFKYAKKLLRDKEDLMHKAVGWMLREAWKKDNIKTEEFLIKNYNDLPRTALRYAIEKMEERKRMMFLKGEF